MGLQDPLLRAARGGEIWAADWVDAGVHLVDADQSKEAVLREIKALIWSALT